MSASKLILAPGQRAILAGNDGAFTMRYGSTAAAKVIGVFSGNLSNSGETVTLIAFVLVIRRLRGSCRNVDIAERMGVAKPSVTKALGNLARRGLAEVVGRDVRLTEEGGRLAEATLDKHRFFERLLVESGVDAETASAEACRMEHCLSEDSYRRFAAYLGSRRDEGDGG